MNDQKINFDLVVKYRRTNESGVAVDTTESGRENVGWRSQYSGCVEFGIDIGRMMLPM